MIKRVSNTILILVVLIVGYLGVAVAATYFNKDIRTVFRKSDSAPITSSETELRVMTWNLGYAGLGEESDFKTDGGDMLLPPSKAIVEKNLTGIKATLKENPADIYLLQEVAGDGLLNRGVNVRGQVSETLADWSMFFSSDIGSKILPKPLRLDHGLATFNRLSNREPQIMRLPKRT